MYRHPAYVDISHFRSPTKNLITQLGGLGAHHGDTMQHYTNHGFGAEDPNAAFEQYASTLFNKQDGMFVFKPEVAASVLDYLQVHRAITLGTQTGERLVQVVPYSPEELAVLATPQGAVLDSFNARKWAEAQVADGMVVFASINVLNPTSEDKYLAAIPAKNKARVKEAASQGTAGILIAPKGALTAGMGSKWWWVLGVGAVAGVGYVATRKKR